MKCKKCDGSWYTTMVKHLDGSATATCCECFLTKAKLEKLIDAINKSGGLRKVRLNK